MWGERQTVAGGGVHLHWLIKRKVVGGREGGAKCKEAVEPFFFFLPQKETESFEAAAVAPPTSV